MLQHQELAEIKKYIENGSKIAITTHTNPDGDAIGSSLAIYHYLKRLGATVTAVVPNKFPGFLHWLNSSQDMVVFESDAKEAKKVLSEADLIFCLDYNALSRVGAVADDLKSATAKRILIDHHIAPETESFNYIISDVTSSSTCELVYEFIVAMGDEAIIDRIISESIYTGIITDTGSFSHSCNNGKTYKITANLIDKGVDAKKIHGLIFDTFSENRLRLLGYSISSRMLVWKELKTALIYLTREDLKKHEYQVGDTEGIVNFALSMENVNMAVLVTEKDKKVRLSFRSKGDFSVNDLCRNHFNGGGHRNAAGGKSSKPIMETIDEIKAVVMTYQDDLNYEVKY